jgi:hypothetical protein
MIDDVVMYYMVDDVVMYYMVGKLCCAGALVLSVCLSIMLVCTTNCTCYQWNWKAHKGRCGWVGG